VIVRGHRLYVVNSDPPEIMVIDPQDDQVEKTIALADTSNPCFLDFIDDDHVYVTNWKLNSVSRVDLQSGTIEKDIPVGPAPQGVLILGDTAFVTNTGVDTSLTMKYDASSITVIDVPADTVLTTLEVPINAQDLALGPDGRVYVVCTGDYVTEDGKVCIIDRWAGPGGGPAVVDTVQIGGAPGDIIVTPAGKAYLADWGSLYNGYLYSYDIYADSVYYDFNDPLLVGVGAMRLYYDPPEDVLYVNNYMDNAVQRFCPHGDTVMATYGFGTGAQDMCVLEAYLTAIDDLQAIKAGDTVQLQWGYKTGADLYRIYYDDMNPEFEPASPADSTTGNTWTDPSAVTGHRYYLVRAVMDGSENENSNRIGAFRTDLDN
jgi:streptogramin lyase